MHTTRIAVAYRPCTGKVKGLKTAYQQQLRYIQEKGLHVTKLELFDKDLTGQLSKWHAEEERIVLLMDVNDHPTEGKFSRKLAKMNLDVHEFSHKCWGPTPPYTHINGTQPIKGGNISSKIEVVNLAMVNFMDSPGCCESYHCTLDVCTMNKVCKYRLYVQDGWLNCILLMRHNNKYFVKY
jgi:hypothetical protein